MPLLKVYILSTRSLPFLVANLKELSQKVTFRLNLTPILLINLRLKMKFIDKKKASEITGLSETTLKRYRLSGILEEGVHWIRLNQKNVKYNQEMLEHWLLTQSS